MSEPSRNFDLAEKAIRAERGGHVGAENFEGDQAAVLEVSSQVYRRGTSLAELSLNQIAIGQGGLQTVEGCGRVGHRVTSAAANAPSDAWRATESGSRRL